MGMRNETIAYLLSFLWRSWFWLGCWIFYYLRFTDYAGIGFLETVMITTMTLGEIPTGAIADIFGKKFSVTMAFLLGAVGNLIMAFAPNYWTLVASIVTMTVGGTFYSGAMQALVYDSLKEEGNETKYRKVIGRMTTMENLGMAVAGIAGGFMYQIWPSLPFVAVAFAYLLGLIISLWLREPRVDSQKYSWKIFIRQNSEGFRQLFLTKRIASLSWLLLVPAAFMVGTENVINDATAVQLGFDSIALGIFATITYLFGIFVSEKTDWFVERFSNRMIYAGVIILYLLSLYLMPVMGFYLGAFLLLLRYGVQTFFGNYESIRLNEFVESKYRATTLSTFSLIKNIPYVLAATGIGFLISTYTATKFSFIYGVFFMVAVVIVILAAKKTIFLATDKEEKQARR